MGPRDATMRRDDGARPSFLSSRSQPTERRRIVDSVAFRRPFTLPSGDSSAIQRLRGILGAMARPVRIEYPGAVYHVTSRGNERKAIFRTDADRETFLAFLGKVVHRFAWRLSAWVLMSNHFHLVSQTPEPNVSRDMRLLNVSCAG